MDMVEQCFSGIAIAWKYTNANARRDINFFILK
jgi:hypothetical protein